jgi:hypothetical protein
MPSTPLAVSLEKRFQPPLDHADVRLWSAEVLVYSNLERFGGAHSETEASEVEFHLIRMYRPVVIRTHQDHVLGLVIAIPRQPLEVMSFSDFAKLTPEW